MSTRAKCKNKNLKSCTVIKIDNLFIKNVEYFLIYIPKINNYINYICI